MFQFVSCGLRFDFRIADSELIKMINRGFKYDVAFILRIVLGEVEFPGYPQPEVWFLYQNLITAHR